MIEIRSGGLSFLSENARQFFYSFYNLIAFLFNASLKQEYIFNGLSENIQATFLSAPK